MITPGTSASETLEYHPPKAAERNFVHTIGGQELAYRTVADWIPLYKEEKSEKPVADVFSVSYFAEQATHAPLRPVTFVFNGGPGSASLYLHMATMGPQRVAFDQATGHLLKPPVTLQENDESWLPFTDLVMFDPVDTGFSRSLEHLEKKEGAPDHGKVRGKEFFDTVRDLDALCNFIKSWLTKHKRWGSPLYIAGESYGGFRAARLVNALQIQHGVPVNGIVIISPVLEWSALDPGDYNFTPWVELFPSLALTAHVHGKCRVEGAAEEVRARAERFAVTDLVSVLIQGDLLSEGDRRTILARAADFLGLDVELVIGNGGRISYDLFRSELLKKERRICSLYDGSVTLQEPFPGRLNGPFVEPLDSMKQVFHCGVNMLLRNQLGVETERQYYTSSPRAFENWTVEEGRGSLQREVGACDDIRMGLAMNPHLKVAIVHGWYDLITPYFHSRRLASLLKLEPWQSAQLQLTNFRGGHMFYTWDDSRRAFRDLGQKLIEETKA